MKKTLRISSMIILCALLLSSVIALPSILKAGEAALPQPQAPENSVSVDGDALDVVDVSKVKYGYSEMTEDLAALASKYPDKMSYTSIGTSLDGRSIYAVTLGDPNAEKQIIISAGIHAREYLTPLLVMKQLEFYLLNYDTADYGGIPLSEILKEYSFRILPMCNPDGVTMAQFGVDALKSEALKTSIRAIYESDKAKGYTTDQFDKYLTYWKANARGVDLNRNFDTEDWATVNNVRSPSYINYRGTSPLSEPESKAMASYVSSLSNPVLSIATHSQGEIIYFDSGKDFHKCLDLAKIAHESCGYKIIYETRHDAAFEDWCVIKKGIPSITVETGNYEVKEPIPSDEFSSIWNACRDLWADVAVKYMEK